MAMVYVLESDLGLVKVAAQQDPALVGSRSALNPDLYIIDHPCLSAEELAQLFPVVPPPMTSIAALQNLRET